MRGSVEGMVKPWSQIGQLCSGKSLRYPKTVKTSKASRFEDPLETLHLKGLITLMFDIFRVTEVTENNLVQLENLDGKPLKTRTPYASVKPVQRSMLIELLKSRL